MLTVFRKEVLDNFRDRRALSSALLFGPLFGPVLFAIIVTVVLSQAMSDAERTLTVPVTGAEHAPRLIAFLEREGIDVETGPADLAAARDPVRSGEHAIVLVIGEDYGERFRAGRPARVQVVKDGSAQRTVALAARVEGVLGAYNHQQRVLRLQARGVSPSVLQAVVVDPVDVSTPTGRALLLLGMLTYFLMFSMLMGGLYLAIDTTAGERERGSLEPLLTLPVSRNRLLLGKIGATCVYMLVSLAITLTAFSVSLRFIPLEELGMSTNLGPVVAAAAFLVAAPFVLLGASLMTLVASFTKSYKEAQSYVSVLLLVPTVPILFAALLSIEPSPWMMAVPSLSQHLLVTELMRGESLSPSLTAVSVVSTLAAGALVTWVTSLFYRREGLLG